MARRDIKGAVDFAYLEEFAAGDETVVDEVLALFREQSSIWGAMLSASNEGWRDGVHTLKGAARGVGAFQLGDACQVCETVGPVALDQVRDALDASGHGLTLGVHSRIEATQRRIAERLRIGNTYVNRNQIGAVVGVQPFGGRGLSGTGPKAGGPITLYRFAEERVISINTAAAGGNAALLASEEG